MSIAIARAADRVETRATADLRLIAWDFGDGTKIESETPAASHIYRDEGSYTVGLSITDEFGATATSFTGVNVVKPPLILLAGDRVLLRDLDSSRLENTQILKLDSGDSFCFYSGEALKAEDNVLVAIPEISSAASNVKALDTNRPGQKGQAEGPDREKLDRQTVVQAERDERLGAIAIPQLAFDHETISEVKADDSVEYQQKDAMSVNVPQHHDLVSDILLQTSSMGYDPTRVDIRSHKKQLRTAVGWSELFLPWRVGESSKRVRD